MRIPSFGKDNSAPQKKLITIKFFDFFNKMVKAESDYKDTTESALVESKVLETYLSNDDRLAEIIANNIHKENGIMICASKIMDIYKAKPELANDTLIDFLIFLRGLIQRHDMHFKTSDKGLDEVARYAEEYEKLIKERTEEDASYSFYDLDGKTTRHVDSFNLYMLRDVAEANKSQHKLDTENVFYLAIENVLTFWNYGGYEDTPTLKHWNITYGLLKAVFDVYKLPDYAPYAYEFSQVVKEIDMTASKAGAYDSKVALSKSIFMNLKAFVTTEDAVIIRSKDNEPDRYFTNAYRIIHGPGKPTPQKPYIILCTDEPDQELSNIIEEKLKDYPEEFPDPADSCHVQFLYDGAYYDKRIRWTTI